MPMLSVIYAECHNHCHYAECRYAECRYAECRGAAVLMRRSTVLNLPLQLMFPGSTFVNNDTTNSSGAPCDA